MNGWDKCLFVEWDHRIPFSIVNAGFRIGSAKVDFSPPFYPLQKPSVGIISKSCLFFAFKSNWHPTISGLKRIEPFLLIFYSFSLFFSLSLSPTHTNTHTHTHSIFQYPIPAVLLLRESSIIHWAKLNLRMPRHFSIFWRLSSLYMD